MRMTSRLAGGPLRFETEVRGHQIVADVPASKGGADPAPMPPDLLAASLGACVGIYAVNFCKKHDIATDGLVVHTDWEQESAPARIARLAVQIEVPAGVPEEKRAAFMRTVEACLIHNTLRQTPQIEVMLADTVQA